MSISISIDLYIYFFFLAQRERLAGAEQSSTGCCCFFLFFFSLYSAHYLFFYNNFLGPVGSYGRLQGTMDLVMCLFLFFCCVWTAQTWTKPNRWKGGVSSRMVFWTEQHIDGTVALSGFEYRCLSNKVLHFWILWFMAWVGCEATAVVFFIAVEGSVYIRSDVHLLLFNIGPVTSETHSENGLPHV